MLKTNWDNKSTDSRCYVLYCFDFDRELTQSLYYFLINYFRNELDIPLEYGGFYDEKYKDVYGKLESVETKIRKSKWNEIVNITLDNGDIRSKIRSVSLEFNITRPIHTTIVLPKEYGFSFEGFVKSYYDFFKPIYGFSYLTNIADWPTAYAIGDWQHVKSVHNIKRISKEEIRNWNKNCEKIKAGFIRDVYEDNILHTHHLEKQVSNSSLNQFIKDHNLGNLKEINKNIHFWRLDEPHLGVARGFLYKTQLLI